MKTNINTTYIILDKGSEDKALYEELLKIRSPILLLTENWFKDYPTIVKLMNNLVEELNNDR